MVFDISIDIARPQCSTAVPSNSNSSPSTSNAQSSTVLPSLFFLLAPVVLDLVFFLPYMPAPKRLVYGSDVIQLYVIFPMTSELMHLPLMLKSFAKVHDLAPGASKNLAQQLHPHVPLSSSPLLESRPPSRPSLLWYRPDSMLRGACRRQ